MNEVRPSRESVGRTILVVEDQPFLWAVLQRRVERATAYVRSATPGELAAVWRTCPPWPWVVVGTSSAVVDGLTELIGGRPIPVHWLGQPPPGTPLGAAAHADWTSLAGALELLNGLVSRGLNGTRLMRNRGLHAPGGRVVLDAPHLEGLLAAGGSWTLTSADGDDALGAAIEEEIRRHRLPLRVERSRGLIRLA